MSRGRPPSPIGVPGRVNLTQLRPGVWQAMVRVRDATGKRRPVKRSSPPKTNSRGHAIPDRDGTRARQAVLVAAAAMGLSPLDAGITPETTIRDLYLEHYRPYLVDQDRASSTLKRYDGEAEHFDSAFGYRRLTETPTPVIEAYLKAVAQTRGPDTAKTARSVLSGMFRYAIRMSEGAVTVNPVREVVMAKKPGSSKKSKGARHLTVEELRYILIAVRTSTLPCPPLLAKAEREKNRKRYAPPTVAEFCERVDLVDWVTLLTATAHRRAQSLAVRWTDLDRDLEILTPSKKLIREIGVGLVLADIDGDTKASENQIALPQFAVEALKARRKRLAERRLLYPDPIKPEFAELVLPSENWTPRDPNNVGAQWRRVRSALDLPDDITPHSFRKAVATIIDDAGLSARVAADVLGHADPSMTQRVYFARGRAHPAAATALHAAIGG